MSRPLFEVCVSSVADALAAVAVGADRIELCSALEVGGLTPSVGLLQSVLGAVSVPVIVMIRPRPGGFCYAPDEFRTALLDAEWALSLGAAGIVFGILSVDCSIDAMRCRELVAMAGERETVFHRAFDFVRDPLAMADQLTELRITRVLTSGQRSTALAGAPLIRTLAKRTAGKLEVLPGGGITADNVQEVIQQTGCNQLHLGSAQVVRDHSVAHCSPIDLVAVHQLAENAHRALDLDELRRVISPTSQRCS